MGDLASRPTVNGSSLTPNAQGSLISTSCIPTDQGFGGSRSIAAVICIPPGDAVNRPFGKTYSWCRRRRTHLACFFLAVLELACTHGGAVDDQTLRAADADTANWLTYGRTYTEQRHSPL